MSAVISSRDPQDLARRVEQAISTAIADLSAGRRDKAVATLARFTPSQDLNAAHQSLIARVLVGAGAHLPAVRWFEGALSADPAFAEALTGRATTLLVLERLEEAAAAFEAALAAGVRDPGALYNFGTVLVRLKRDAEALAAFDLAVTLRPAFPAALRAAGRLLDTKGQTAAALHLFAEATRHAPRDIDAVLDLANLLRRGERLVEALAVYDTALTHSPEHALLWNNHGMVLHDLGRMDEAIESLEQALSLDPAMAQAHMNRGNVLIRLNRQEDSLAAFAEALNLRPVYPEALSSRGLALKMLGRFEAARADFDAALRQDPNFIYAIANRGELNLLLGHFGPGWPEYEYRFFTERQQKPALKTPVPEWRGPGDRVARLAVFADQGSGDSLQFSRFLPEVAAHAAEVTLICLPRLQRILSDVTGGLHVCGSVADDAVFDAQITLSSLPTVFKTNLDTLASSRPYLRPEPALVQRWAPRIAGEGLKVGLCWRGSQNWQCDPNRSVPFGALAPLADVPGLRLFSLQMPDNAERLGEARSLAVEDLSGELDTGADAFIDTAAVIAHLDLVISCDTSIAHLAGALGRPVWVLLQAVPEWRWLLGRDTSPWYPTMLLFRQTQAGDWTGPIGEVTKALRTLARA
ncbi:tetratricopeptide repeat protein [Lichenifustis flavocetrariae]|uniref:Tetratricopeptide repeat protein n=1 Tax=Lichenifustis flavocetrariae TaxID=2949735 RepID=A0AA42CI49_9HYPH|nr:tetratricopeptide repeat protein [Lichenifustis flavocetrariae]MCW6506451.1 tetratricopeptide repeat protein [Lichenifustis flavocetrariae]